MIQIDMPMPKNCFDCIACNEYLMCAIPVKGRKWGENDIQDYSQGRPEWCPMKEQPERKTAHWVFGNTMGHSWMKCSECCVSQSGQTGCWTYCPNCGAEMKGETEVEIN